MSIRKHESRRSRRLARRLARVSPPTLPIGSAGDRAVAWVGAIMAASVSIAVNIGHAWPGGLGFVAYSAALPLLLLISAEQMARRLLGAWTLPTLLGVGICTYSLSFWHAYLLLRGWGEPAPLAGAGAFGVDGLAVGSVVALYRVGAGRIAHSQAAPVTLTDQSTSVRPVPDGVPADGPDSQPGGPSAGRRKHPADVHPMKRPARIASPAGTGAALAADPPSGGHPSTPEPARPAAARPAAPPNVQVATSVLGPGGQGGASTRTPEFSYAPNGNPLDAALDLHLAGRMNGRPAVHPDGPTLATLARTNGRGTEPSTPDGSVPSTHANIWKLWDERQPGDGRTYGWLGDRLGVSAETARGRARRRASGEGSPGEEMDGS